MVVAAVFIFIALLLVLVLVHEWGHFYAAKKAGCNVEEFGFGFPPRVIGKKWRGTIYSLNLLPIGGFVKIEGEDMAEADPGPGSFASKSATWRIIILSAGVAMNVLLAWVLFTVQAGIGAPIIETEANASSLNDLKTYILDIAEGSPAAEAGIENFDRIVSIDGISDPSIPEVQEAVAAKLGEPIALTVDRQGVKHDLSLVPRAEPPPEEGALGVALAATGLHKVSWWQAPWEGLKKTGALLVAIVTQFGIIIGRLFTEGSAGTGLTGPVGLAVYTNEATKLGLSYFLEFAGLISLNLAIINILPLPALDGGRIAFVLIEKASGKRVSAKFESMTHMFGFLALIALMILITIKDVRQFF